MIDEKKTAYAVALKLIAELIMTKDETKTVILIGLLLENVIKLNPNKR